MFDFMNALGKLKEVQSKMEELKAQLPNITASAETGGGMVKVTLNGLKEVVSLEIDQNMVTAEDLPSLQILIKAAINKANQEVEEKASEHMKNGMRGSLPNIPGLDSMLQGLGR